MESLKDLGIKKKRVNGKSVYVKTWQRMGVLNRLSFFFAKKSRH
jgi:hypothetical protein